MSDGYKDAFFHIALGWRKASKAHRDYVEGTEARTGLRLDQEQQAEARRLGAEADRLWLMLVSGLDMAIEVEPGGESK